MEIIKAFLPLIGVVIGSALTIAGTIYQRRSSAREDHRKLLREKLEYLFLQLSALERWMEDAGKNAMRVRFGKQPNLPKPSDESPMPQIDMLVRLYFPSLRPGSEALSSAAEKLRKGLFTYYADVLSRTELPSQDKFTEFVTQPSTELDHLRVELLKQVEQEARKDV